MQTTKDPVYSASSPPFVLDSDMPGHLDHDPDFEFFNSDLSLDGVNSPGIFLGEEFPTESPPHFATLGSPKAAQKNPIPDQTAVLESRLHQPVSAPSTSSPAGSYQDDSSESSGYKRKSSSDSSRSILTSGDMVMADDTGMAHWKVDAAGGQSDQTNFVAYDGTINPNSMDNAFEFNDKAMENDFDFDSAASSPSPFGSGSMDMESPEMPTIKCEGPSKRSSMLENRSRNRKSNSVGL